MTERHECIGGEPIGRASPIPPHDDLGEYTDRTLVGRQLGRRFKVAANLFGGFQRIGLILDPGDDGIGDVWLC